MHLASRTIVSPVPCLFLSLAIVQLSKRSLNNVLPNSGQELPCMKRACAGHKEVFTVRMLVYYLVLVQTQGTPDNEKRSVRLNSSFILVSEECTHQHIAIRFNFKSRNVVSLHVIHHILRRLLQFFRDILAK